MKLYATVTSERASKGQGGNGYLDIVVTGEGNAIIAHLSFYPDAPHRITVRDDIEVDIDRVDPGAWNLARTKETKGEKQKGEPEPEDGGCIYNHEHGDRRNCVYHD